MGNRRFQWGSSSWLKSLNDLGPAKSSDPTANKFTYIPLIYPHPCSLDTAARQRGEQLPSLTFSNIQVRYSLKLPFQLLISFVYNYEIVPTCTVEDQAESAKHLPSKGACIILHYVVLITEPSYAGVMHTAFPGTLPHGEDSSKKILAKLSGWI